MSNKQFLSLSLSLSPAPRRRIPLPVGKVDEVIPVLPMQPEVVEEGVVGEIPHEPPDVSDDSDDVVDDAVHRSTRVRKPPKWMTDGAYNLLQQKIDKQFKSEFVLKLLELPKGSTEIQVKLFERAIQLLCDA